MEKKGLHKFITFFAPPYYITLGPEKQNCFYEIQTRKQLNGPPDGVTATY